MPLTVRPSPGSGLPRLPASPFQRAMPNTPADRNGCICRLLPHPARPSPNLRRVGIRDFTFEACSGFTHVTAHWIAQPPKAAFVTRLQPSRLPDQAARQLPDLTDNCLGGSSFHWCYAPSGRTENSRLRRAKSSIAGPFKTVPSAANWDPWQGQSQHCSSWFHATVQPA